MRFVHRERAHDARRGQMHIQICGKNRVEDVVGISAVRHPRRGTGSRKHPDRDMSPEDHRPRLIASKGHQHSISTAGLADAPCVRHLLSCGVVQFDHRSQLPTAGREHSAHRHMCRRADRRTSWRNNDCQKMDSKGEEPRRCRAYSGKWRMSRLVSKNCRKTITDGERGMRVIEGNSELCLETQLQTSTEGRSKKRSACTCGVEISPSEFGIEVDETEG